MKHIAFFKHDCSMCKEHAMETNLYEGMIPDFGDTLFYIMHCTKCGYRMTDIGSFEKKDPVRYTLTIKGDLSPKIIKGSMGKILIPGLIESEGGIFSEGYITNVEGLLIRLRDILEFIKKYEDPGTRKLIDRRIRKIDDTMEGKAHFDLVLEDYTGNSAILSGSARRELII